MAIETMDAIAQSQRVLANALPVLVMMADADGIVNFFNDAWFEYTGQPRFQRDSTEEWRAYIHPDDVQRVGEAWYAGMSSGSDVEVEYRVRHGASGEWRWFTAHARALRDGSDRIVQWIGTAMEVHQARQAKDSLELLYRQQRKVSESFQQAALPRKLPTVPGVTFDAVYEPSSRELQVGGDWYDAFELSDGTIAISVGDVNGHGLDAAVLMNKLRHSLRAVAMRAAQFQNTDPASIMASVEDMIAIEDEDLMASAFFGIIDLKTRTMTYSNAGHPPALLCRSDGSIEELSEHDTPLGWRFDLKRTTQFVSLAEATRLICYTDGLIESSRDMLQGEARLREAVRALAGAEVETPATFLLHNTVEGDSADDIAVLTLTFS